MTEHQGVAAPVVEHHVRVAVIGAGFAGIGAAIRLARSGETSFAVLERAASVGGTWRDNVYPGVACDIPSHLYSFSFAPKPDWTNRFADGEEIRAYLERCATENSVRQRIRTGVELRGATWDAGTARWRLETSSGPLTAAVLVLATGRFSDPFTPDLPGLDGFTGPTCHTARWDDAVVAPGMRVGVVGTGASAVQLVPRLVAAGADVTVFQRTPPWVIPKENARYAPADLAAFLADDTARAHHRRQIFEQMDSGITARRFGSAENAELGRIALDHLETQVADPKLRRRLTPSYTVGCKRVVLSDDWYPTLASSRSTLESSALSRISGGTAIAASGARYDLDSIVFATGFQASRPAVARLVRGRDGRLLGDHWRAGMTSYGSTVVSGFPNCFLIGGPNSALGHNSAITMIEAQISHLLDALDHLLDGSVCEVRASAEADYTAMIDTRAATTVWAAGGCDSWYLDEAAGRLTLLWPGTAAEYAERYGRFDPAQYRFDNAVRDPLRESSAFASTPPGRPLLQEIGA